MSTRSLVRPEGCPSLHYSHASHCIKGEDIAFVYDGLQLLCPEPQLMGKWDLFCVCDGHGGPEAADFAKLNLPALIASGLPKGQPPETESEEGKSWLQTVRGAISRAFVQLDLDFRKEEIMPTVGCTVTVALICGWVLTVANVGDSEACLDLGSGNPIDITISHKIETNIDEQIRLTKCGKQLRPLSEELFRPARPYEEGVGPLRVWPCGLAVSRAIGDYDCGHEVLASPQIIQVKVPFAGARLTIASDGLWDHLTIKRVVKRSRKHLIRDVPYALIAKARKVSSFGLADDTTVLALDILPTPRIDFKDVSRKVRGPRHVLSKWGKSISSKWNKGYPSIILISEDSAPVEPVPYPSFRSDLTTTSSKNIRPREHTLMRNQTFAGMSGAYESDSQSQDDEDEKARGEEGASLNLDNEGGGSEAFSSMRRYHSSTLEYN